MQPSFVEAHNAEAKAVWDAFDARRPIRPPVVLGTATQFFILNEELNPAGAVTFEQYCTDADTMLDFQLMAAKWRSTRIAPYCDGQIGMPPNREAWLVRIDLQNFDEAAHLGAPVIFMQGQAPDMLELWQERLRREPEYAGWPVKIDPFGWWSGGPLTLAVSLRGHELMTDFYEDPEYVRTLLAYLTDVTIARVRAHARFWGMQDPPDSLWFADDALQMLSVKMAREFVLREANNLAPGTPHSNVAAMYEAARCWSGYRG